MATLPTIRLGMRLYLLTMVRKSELQDAKWDEVDFENAVWTIPKERMKRSKAHNVYLSLQALDIMIALRTCAGNSRYLLPSRYDADAPMSRATFNRVTYAVVEQAKKDRLPLEPFTVHDLRRTGSTLLNELGFNSDWIEKSLAHEDGRSSRGIYNLLIRFDDKAKRSGKTFQHIDNRLASCVDALLMSVMPGARSTTALERVSRMREMFEAEQAVLAEDYEHFTRPRSPATIPDAPSRPNTAARRSAKPTAPQDPERN